jgi:hypothetical protein
MNLHALINGAADLGNINWGCRPGSVYRMTRSLLGAEAVDPMAGFHEAGRLDLIQNKPDLQTSGSCTANGETGWQEGQEWFWRHQVRQLKYNLVYLRMRQDRGDMDDTGGSLPEGVECAIRHGLLPKDTRIIRPAQTARAICNAIDLYGGVLIGLTVHDGYKDSRLAPNGMIDVTGAGPNLMPYTQGHCLWVPKAAFAQNGVPHLGARQSWGRLAEHPEPIHVPGEPGAVDPLWGGLIWIPFDHYLTWAIDFAVAIDCPSYKDHVIPDEWIEAAV